MTNGTRSAKIRAIVFGALAALLMIAAALSERIAPYDPNKQDLSAAMRPPSLAHPMGTDRYGRDMFSRVLVGAKVSVYSTLSLVAIITAAGTAAGAIGAWRGGAADTLLMRTADICLAFPGLVFALAVAARLRGGVHNAVLALACISWPKYARLARGATLALRDADFIHAARLAGCTDAQMIRHHILPNIIGPILVTAMLDIGTMMMELAALSFLGLGASPPTAEWGSMMAEARSLLQIYPWVVLSPGIGIFVTVVIFNLLGDAVRDLIDTRGREFGATLTPRRKALGGQR